MPSPHDSSSNDDPGPVHVGINDLQNNPLEYLEALSSIRVQEPLVDRQVLQELEECLEDSAAAQNFAKDFARAWESKFQRLVVSVDQGNQDGATEAVLSVKVTSIMVGAMRLAGLAASFEQLVRNNDLAAAAQILPSVEECGEDTKRELLENYIR